jgi:uncharacterized membrane protein YjjP (DUF1212 family)
MNLDRSDSLPDPEEVLLLAADAARVVLESGAETYRAEETAQAVCSSLGGVEAECFATPTGVMLSFYGLDGRVRSIVRRVAKRSMNLERIARVNALSRDLYAGRLDFDGASEELGRIELIKSYPLPISMLAAALGTGSFTLLFGGRWDDALVTAVVGALLSRLTKFLNSRGVSDFFTNIVGGAIAAFACLLAGRLGLSSHPEIAVIGVIMLLVPGVAITNAIRDIIAGDLVAGVARGAEAFMAAAAISIGAGAAFEFWRLLGGGPL